MRARGAARECRSSEDRERHEKRHGDRGPCQQPCIESFHEPPFSSLVVWCSARNCSPFLDAATPKSLSCALPNDDAHRTGGPTLESWPKSSPLTPVLCTACVK